MGNLLGPDILWEWYVFVNPAHEFQVIAPKVDRTNPEDVKKSAELFLQAAMAYANSLGLKVDLRGHA